MSEKNGEDGLGDLRVDPSKIHKDQIYPPWLDEDDIRHSSIGLSGVRDSDLEKETTIYGHNSS